MSALSDGGLAWLTQPWVVTILCVMSAVVMERLLPLRRVSHPIGIFFIIAHQMSLAVAKVHHKPALWMGVFCWLILVLPIVAIIAFLLQLAEYRVLLEGILLWLCIGQFGVSNITKRVYGYLLRDKKQLARDTLAPYVLRETNTLSPLGIAKTHAEMLILRHFQQVIVTIFWFVLFGIEAALVYRLTLELQQAFNTKKIEFKEAGILLLWISRFFQWPVAALYTFCIWLFHPQKVWQALAVLAHKNPSNLVLASIGKSIGCQFCGPAIYSGKKIRTAKCGDVFPLKLDHLRLIKPQQNLYLSTFLIFCIALAFVVH